MLSPGKLDMMNVVREEIFHILQKVAFDFFLQYRPGKRAAIRADACQMIDAAIHIALVFAMHIGTAAPAG